MKTLRAWHQLQVEEIGSFVFRVQSESGGAPYTVDPLENGGRGRCDCKDFQCRIAPIYSGKHSEPQGDPHWVSSCKHQLAVNQHIARQLVQDMIKQHKWARKQDGP